MVKTGTTNNKDNSKTSQPPLVILRNATLEDLALIEQWDEAPHLQDPNVMGDEDWNDWNWEYELAREVPWRRQLIAMTTSNDSTPIGVVQIIDPLEEESHYWGNHNGTAANSEDPAMAFSLKHTRALDIWIGEPSFLNRGYGTQMMQQALEGSFCFGDATVQAAIVDPMLSNPKAHKFYQSLGFRPLGTRMFGPDECLVHRVTRQEYFDNKTKKEEKKTS